MKKRFEGRGLPLLLEALQKQELVGGDATIAVAFAKVGSLVEFAGGDTLMREGDADYDLYLLLTGSVAVIVKGREIALRRASTHVGEMSALEPAQPRAATGVAQDATVALKLTSIGLLSIGEAYPRIWRTMARDLARRLPLQRDAGIDHPERRPHRL